MQNLKGETDMAVEIIRCPWCGTDPLYVDYHDKVWGRPVTNSKDLFAKLCLDGQQAGLSWITILRKQAGYETAFHDFNPEKLVAFTDADVERLMLDSGIVRNRLKIKSIIRNAGAYLSLQEKGMPLNRFLWQFFDGKPLVNRYSRMDQVPAKTDLSDQVSKALKQAGFNFVGSTIVYAFMQATGFINDHLVGCPQHQICSDLGLQMPSLDEI